MTTPAEHAAEIANLAKARAALESKSTTKSKTAGKRHLRSSRSIRKGTIRTRVVHGKRYTSWLEIFKKDLY